MSDYSRFQFLKVEINKDKIALVTLNRPESLNSFAPGMHQEVEDVLHELSQDQEVKVILITGAGRAFSAGADVKGQNKRATTFTAADQIALFRTAPRLKLIRNMIDVRQPMIAAVNGPAVGLGATVALFCDIVIASDKARFGDTHVKSGMVPGDGGCVIWPLLVGTPKAKELLWTGDLISADEAKQLADRLGALHPRDQIRIATVSPVIGTYVGPHVLSVSVLGGE